MWLGRDSHLEDGYLRACGGTNFIRCCGSPISGLSPRVRRNLAISSATPVSLGAISARAEEPQSIPIQPYVKWGYLRACGGTVLRLSFSALH